MKIKLIQFWMWLKGLRWYFKLAIAVALITGLYFGYTQLFNQETEVTYQTATVGKGTLITSISATGSISSGNTTNISTKASGIVKKIYVENGDTVKKGQKLLDITLDSDGIERRSTAWTAYLTAKEAVVTAKKTKEDTVIDVWEDRQAIVDAETIVNHVENLAGLTDDQKHQKQEAVTQAKLAFDIDAEKLLHVDEKIAAAEISLQASYLDYQDVSGTIVAPADGIVNNLTLTAGSTLAASSSQSTSTGSTYASSQTIGFIRAANNEYLARVSLTEVDVTKVKAGQKVMMTMDAHPDKTFTGKVLAVDVSGSITSGVTAYPATIVMDATELPIYPNMTVSATIITNTVTDVLLVNSSAITTATDGTSTVYIMRDGNTTLVSVELGDTNDTQTVVTSGLSEGDVIVTGAANSVKNSNTSSAFDSTSTRTNSSSGIGGDMMMGGPGF